MCASLVLEGLYASPRRFSAFAGVALDQRHRITAKAMPLTRSAARRSHRALSSDDVLSAVFSFLDPLAGFGAATACKTSRDAWRLRCRGMLRVHRQRIGEFQYSDHCVAYGDGVMVANYGRMAYSGYLATFSNDGVADTELNRNLNTPLVVALRGDGTAWVLLSDDEVIVCVRLAELPTAGEDSHEAYVSYNEFLMRIEMADAYWINTFVLAGDALLVLYCSSGHSFEYETARFIDVYDNQTGTLLRKFALAEQTEILYDEEEQGGIAVQGDALYIVRRNADIVDVYNWREGILSRSFGRGRVRFDGPYGISVRGKTMYVSERRQIQVLRLPDDDSAEPEILQVIPSPDGEELGGLCLNGDRLWCMGPKYLRGELRTQLEGTYVHLFGPCY